MDGGSHFDRDCLDFLFSIFLGFRFAGRAAAGRNGEQARQGESAGKGVTAGAAGDLVAHRMDPGGRWQTWWFRLYTGVVYRYITDAPGSHAPKVMVKIGRAHV